MEEEIYILGPALLERPRGPLRNRHDARDEESLRDPAWLLGVYGKTKDTPEAREDQQRMHGKDGIHQGHASYALTKEEKEIFFECLLSMKVQSGLSSNIKGIINMLEKKFQNLKSHDCHVIMMQLLPVVLRELSTGKRSISRCEAMCIPQCNLSEGDGSRNSTKVKE